MFGGCSVELLWRRTGACATADVPSLSELIEVLHHGLKPLCDVDGPG